MSHELIKLLNALLESEKVYYKHRGPTLCALQFGIWRNGHSRLAWFNFQRSTVGVFFVQQARCVQQIRRYLNRNRTRFKITL
jgi:hypothetical protein